MNKVFFDNAAKAKAEYIIHNRYSQFSNLESFELKNLAVVWCYYSGRIEGNTYSLVETEALIKDDIIFGGYNLYKFSSYECSTYTSA